MRMRAAGPRTAFVFDSGGWLGAVLGTVLGAVLVAVLGAVLGPSPAEAQRREAFERGIEAIDLGRFGDAAPALRQAVREDGTESAERVFLSGVFSRPYLPHFFLGWALYNQGLEHCQEALEALAESERQGVVEEFRRHRQDLRTARSACTDHLLPSATRRAETAFEQARDALERLPTTVAGRQARAARLDVLGQRLEEARGSGDRSGDRSGDPLALVSLSTEAEALLDELSALEAENATADDDTADDGTADDGTADDDTAELVDQARRANAFQAASGAARDAASQAERQRRQLDDLLDDPLHGEARRRLLDAPSQAAARELTDIRRRLAAATTTEQVETIADQARRLASRLDGLLETGRAIRAPREDERRASPDSEPPAGPNAGRSANRGESVPAARVAEVRERAGRAQALLRTLDAAESTSPAHTDAAPGASPGAADESALLARQRRRLDALVAEATAWLAEPRADAAADLLARLDGSELALRLLAGTGRYFAGQPRAALELLVLPGATERTWPELAAHLLLVRAASHFELYRLGGELDPDRRRQALDDARASRRLAPDLAPDDGAFSPVFRRFFAEASTVASTERALQNR